jgi:hypothetical protein
MVLPSSTGLGRQTHAEELSGTIVDAETSPKFLLVVGIELRLDSASSCAPIILTTVNCCQINLAEQYAFLIYPHAIEHKDKV